MKPDLTVILICRNEASFIGPCLRSLLTQQLPGSRLEVLVVDGASTDGTRQQAQAFAAHDERLQVLDNPEQLVPTGLNLAISAARGPVIVRMDAHCTYPPDYLANRLSALERSGADNVAGVILTLPRGSGLQARLVRALSTHPFGVGDAGFRVGAREGPADTVPFGCFPRRTFESYGLFDERLVRNQDYEFNARIRAAGGTVWLDPYITLEYYNKARFAGLLHQAWHTGRWNALTWYLAPYSLRLRHVIPGLFVLGAVLGAVVTLAFPMLAPYYLAVLLLYAALALGAALQQALRFRDALLLPLLPAAFLAHHLAYGSGTLLGCILIALRRTPFGLDSRPWRGGASHPPQAGWSEGEGVTRAFDVLLASLALLVLTPLMLLLALLIRLDSPGGTLFRQRRVGWRGHDFTIYMFRTMVMGTSQLGSSVTTATDPRVTRFGALLRRAKLDELPQLFNVIRGDMALVGPRPEVPEVVALYNDDMRGVLEMRPGITSLTSLDLSDEEGLLATAVVPDDFYLQILLPAKVADSIRRSTPSGPLTTLRVLSATAVTGFRRLLGRTSERALMADLRRHPELTAARVPSNLLPADYSTPSVSSRSAVDSTKLKEAT